MTFKAQGIMPFLKRNFNEVKKISYILSITCKYTIIWFCMPTRFKKYIFKRYDEIGEDCDLTNIEVYSVMKMYISMYHIFLKSTVYEIASQVKRPWKGMD